MQTRIIIALIGLSIAGCQKPVAVEEAQEIAPTQNVILLAATPTPVPARPKTWVEPPPPEVRTTLPEGVFALRFHKSVVTDEGITGFPPGTLVSLVRPGVFAVDGRELELKPDEVTNDLAFARSLRHLDIRNQAVIRRRVATPEPVAPVVSVGPARVEYAPAPSGALDVSSSLGNSHSRYKDGWKWQRDGSGKWVRTERLK